jgi:hypothetical protein
MVGLKTYETHEGPHTWDLTWLFIHDGLKVELIGLSVNKIWFFLWQ